MINPLSAGKKALETGKGALEIRKEAKIRETELKSKISEGSSKKGWVKMKVNGLQEIVDITIDDNLMELSKKKDLIQALKEAQADVTAKLQKEVMAQMKGMDMNKIKDMLGM